MATYYPSTPFPVQFINPDTGELLSGGVLRAYAAGGTTPTLMYRDGSGTSAGSSITLNAGGYPTVSGNIIVIWLDVSVDYKFVLEDADGGGKWTVDNIVSLTNSFLASNVFGVCKTVADMTSASGPLLTNGQRLTSTLVAAAANTGALIRTSMNNTTSRLGGADYEIKTLAQHRTDIGDGAWVPDGYADHYLLGGTTYIALLTSQTNEYKLAQFGCLGTGIDETTIIAAALVFVEAKKGKLIANQGKSYGLSAGLSIQDNTVFWGYGATLKPTANIADTMLTVENGGQVAGFAVDCRTFNVDVVLQLIPETSLGRIIFSAAYDWAMDITPTGKSAGPTGTVILIDAQSNGVSDGSIQLTNCSRIKANYFNKGIYTKVTGSSWANSNVFKDCEMSRCNYPIHEESISNGTIAANEYPNFIFQHASGNTGFIFHSRARMNGLIWDGGSIEFVSDNNVLDVMSSSMFAITDNGRNNKIKGHTYEYFDGRCSFNGDLRPRLTGFRGLVSFVDHFLGASFALPWVLSGTGSPTAFSSSTLRGTTNFYPETGTVIQTGAVLNDTGILDFSGAKPWTVEMKPVMHFTGRWISNTDQTIFAGLYADANNYIGLSCSTYGGNINLVTASGGVTTSQTIYRTNDGTTPLTLNYLNFYFVSLRITGSSVTASVGVETQTSSNLYQGIYLQEKSGTAYSATVTTNIPSVTFLGPRFSIETLTAASVRMNMTDVQIYSQMGVT